MLPAINYSDLSGVITEVATLPIGIASHTTIMYRGGCSTMGVLELLAHRHSTRCVSNHGDVLGYHRPHAYCLLSYHGDCYGALLRDMTSFEVVRETLCDHCDYSSEESQIQCILRVEPAHSEAEASIGVALQTAPLEDFKCQVCHGKGGRQEIRFCDLLSFEFCISTNMQMLLAHPWMRSCTLLALLCSASL